MQPKQFILFTSLSWGISATCAYIDRAEISGWFFATACFCVGAVCYFCGRDSMR